LTPPNATASDRRTQLLAAARDVFSKKGYDNATVSEIVGKAGVAQGTFYLYFAGKDGLAGAFAEALAERFAVVAEERTVRCRTFDTAILRMVEAAFEVADEYRDVYLIANRGLELIGDRDDWMTRTAPSREWLEGFIRLWQSNGAIHAKARPPVVARVLRDGLDRAAKSYVLFGDRQYGRDLAVLISRGLAAPAAGA
jgi:AcrR family transcriptional regulator